MQSSAPITLQNSKKRPIAISIFAALLLLFGVILAAAGTLAAWLHSSIQVFINPLNHPFSLFFRWWALFMILVGSAVWFIWTGHGLWRMRRIGQLLAQCILGLILFRGLLVLIPPLEGGELAFAIWVIIGTCFGFSLLWHYSRTFQ
jgi:hypothetical protein